MIKIFSDPSLPSFHGVCVGGGKGLGGDEREAGGGGGSAGQASCPGQDILIK